MKRFTNYVFLIATSVLLMSSCVSSLPDRFDSFINSIEKESVSYSEKDWAKANEKFEKLFNEYKENRSSFSYEEKKRINTSIARYAKIVAKSNINVIIDSAREVYEQLPILMDGLKSFFQELSLETKSDSNEDL